MALIDVTAYASASSEWITTFGDEAGVVAGAGAGWTVSVQSAPAQGSIRSLTLSGWEYVANVAASGTDSCVFRFSPPAGQSVDVTANIGLGSID